MSTGIQSSPLTNLNQANAERKRMVVNIALTRLVGVVQDLLAMSGYSLSRLLYQQGSAYVTSTVGSKVGSIVGAKVGTAVSLATGAAIRPFTVALIGIMLKPLVSTGLNRRLPSYMGGAVNAAFVDRVLSRSQRTVQAILRDQNVDVRPLVSAIIMAMNARDVRRLGQDTLRGLLDTYVYSKVASSGPGVMCKLCGSVTCSGQGTVQASKMGASGPKMAALVAKALRSINELLPLEDRSLTVTKAVRFALSHYLPSKATVAARMVPSQLVSVAGLIATAMYPAIRQRIRALGLDIEYADFAAIATKDLQTLRAFVAGDPKANIEPFLVRVVAGSKPLGLVAGAVGALTARGATTSEFCQLCRSTYSTCIR